MALFGLSITKQVAFRDSTQPFSNVYHYRYDGLNPSEALANDIINTIVGLEKTWHSSLVTFVYARLWSAGGTVAQNQMIAQGPLTGVGSASPDSTIDRERAVLVQWDNGLDSLGRVKRLKKWYHLCSTSWFGVGASSGIIANSTGFTSANRSTMAGNANDFSSPIVNALPITLCSPSGEEWENDAVVHRYLEHHQLGDQWR